MDSRPLQRLLASLVVVAGCLCIAVFVVSCGGDSKSDNESTTAIELPPPTETSPEEPKPKAARKTSPGKQSVALGKSVKGETIRAWVIGDINSPTAALVVGCIHGDEPAGEAVSRFLRTAKPPSGTALWLVDEFNPDGCAVGTRQNANGVDLNRNSPWKWKPIEEPGSTYYSGTKALSEPESRAINRLVHRLHPIVSVWYHQHAALVDSSSGGDRQLERAYARRVGLPLKDYGVFPGSITTWQDSTYPEDTAFVVELPTGELSSADVETHADAVLELIREAQASGGEAPPLETAPPPGSENIPPSSPRPGTSAD